VKRLNPKSQGGRTEAKKRWGGPNNQVQDRNNPNPRPAAIQRRKDPERRHGETKALEKRNGGKRILRIGQRVVIQKEKGREQGRSNSGREEEKIPADPLNKQRGKESKARAKCRIHAFN